MCVIVLAMVLLVSRAGAVVDGRPAPYNDRRFDAVGLVLTVQPWAPCGGWISGSCTLIAPNMVMLAKHSVQRSDQTLPPAGQHSHRIRFRRAANGTAENHFAGNSTDCTTPNQEIYIDRFVACPLAGVDIVLGILESEPVGITPIGVDISFGFGRGHAITLAGWGYDGRCIQTGDAGFASVCSGWNSEHCVRTSAAQLSAVTNPILLNAVLFCTTATPQTCFRRITCSDR